MPVDNDEDVGERRPDRRLLERLGWLAHWLAGDDMASLTPSWPPPPPLPPRHNHPPHTAHDARLMK